MASVPQAFLREIYVDPQPQVDIVAVHGLNPVNRANHAYSTWSQDGVLWLKDLLPKNSRRPRLRVLLYGYNSSAVFGGSTGGIQAASLSLLDELRIKRQECLYRPIVFLCHSLGGIVAKNALINAYIDPSHKSLYASTKGFAFFATPHRGAGNKVTLADAVVRVVRTFGYARNDIMEALRNDSIISGPINQQYRHLAIDMGIVSFIETRPMPRLGLIVQRNSAVLDLPSEDQVFVEATHSGICKFSNPNAEIYRRIEDHIIGLLNKAVQATSVPTSTSSIIYDTEDFPQETPPPYQTPLESLYELKPTLEIKEGLTSENYNVDDDRITTEHNQDPSVLRLFRGFSSLLPLHTTSSTKLVVDEKSIQWPLTSPQLMDKYGFSTTQTVQRHRLFDCLVVSLFQKRPILLYGVGGSGKSQLAMSLAHWFFERNPSSSILWVNASTSETCSAGLESIISACGIKHASRDWRYLSLKVWLEDLSHGRWLLIFDSVTAEAMEIFVSYLPNCTHGQVILTSSTQKIASQLSLDVIELEVRSFEEAEAMELVKATLSDKLMNVRHEASIREIILRLELLPLVVSQAIAYMNATNLTPTEYLKKMSSGEFISELLAFVPDPSSEISSKPLYAVWQNSFDEIESKDALAAQILSFASFLEPQEIPVSLISKGLSASPLTMNISCLETYGFARSNAGSDSFDMNKIVQAGVQRWLGRRKREWAEKVLRAISGIFPDVEETKMRTECLLLLPHALSILRSANFSDYPLSLHSAGDIERYFEQNMGHEGPSVDRAIGRAIITLRSKIGIFFHFEGSYPSAQEHLQAVCSNVDAAEELSDDRMLRVQSALINSLRVQGSIASAHEMAHGMKKANKARYGRKSRRTCEAYRLLALTFQDSGKNEKALKSAKRALSCASAIDDNANSIDVLRCQRRVATTYEILNRFSEAERAMTAAVLGYKARDEENSTDALDAQFRLSWLQRALGHYEDSEITARQCYRQYVEIKGPQNDQSLKALHSLAVTRLCMEQWEEAATDFENILEYCLSTPGFGADHSYAQILRVDLAQAYEGMGSEHYEDAKQLYDTALRVRETSLDADHPVILLNKAQILGVTWKLNPRDADATETACQSLLKSLKSNSRDHHEARCRLFRILAEINAHRATTDDSGSQKKVHAHLKKAAELQVQVLKSRDKVNGRRHPETQKAAEESVRHHLKSGDFKTVASIRQQYRLEEDL